MYEFISALPPLAAGFPLHVFLSSFGPSAPRSLCERLVARARPPPLVGDWTLHTCISRRPRPRAHALEQGSPVWLRGWACVPA
eukprot:2872441-Lingulodinium_polyedra.AAC.1